MPGLDTGNTGFMLLCTSLVMLMTPGLAFFYGGLVGRKNVLSIMMQSFVSMGWTTVIWFAVGYSLCFSGDTAGIIGNLDGAVAGLATITPAAGFVSPVAAVVIGIVAGVVCYGAVALKNRLKWDDALDVWGVHGVGGFIGILMLGLFATTSFNPAGTNGLFAGNPAFFLKQVVAVLASSVWAFGFTYGMLWLIDRVTPVRVGEQVEVTGLDAGLHGEEAYVGAL